MSDVGKVALGGLIALSGQLAAPFIAWFKEAQFAASRNRKEAEYLAMRLVLIMDKLVNDCVLTVCDPLTEDQSGCSESTVVDPKLTLPEGDYKSLPRYMMYDIISMPNLLDGIRDGMSSAHEFSSGPPDFKEFFDYRREHWSRFGLKALELIDQLCAQYKIPLPERPEYYNPKELFKTELKKIASGQRDLLKRNERMS